MSIIFIYLIIGLLILLTQINYLSYRMKRENRGPLFGLAFVIIFPIIYGPILLYMVVTKDG